MNIEKSKSYAVNGVEAIAKSVFKIGIFVTGIATFFLPWLNTPFGEQPIVQVFGTLNILIAVGWEFQNNFKKPAKKKIAKRLSAATASVADLIGSTVRTYPYEINHPQLVRVE